MRALVVDDSRTMRTILSRILGSLGIDVNQAADGRDALESLDAEGIPDLALVDWHMPGMNGLELVAAVRAQSRCDGMFVVMVTTESEPEQVSAALSAGADEYIVKPFSAESIGEKLSLLGIDANATVSRTDLGGGER
jgi:two-component system chemotaxis response regulator CheY